MNRVKGVYRSWAIPCAGQTVYAPRHRSAWLEKLVQPGVRRRAEQLYQQLDKLVEIRREARRELLRESRKHPAREFLSQIPRFGPIRVALLIALLQTPHRFRTKRQLWAYCGLALQTRSSGEYRYTGGQLQHSKRPPAIRGLNVNHNHDLKSLFKSTATQASGANDPWGDFLSEFASARNEAGHGAVDPGAQDGGDCVETLEERRTLQSRTIETEIRLSVGEEPKPTQSHARRWPVDSPSARFEGEYPTLS
jgi:hypothetical protein